MTAASQSRRERRSRGRGRLEMLDRPPVFCDLRPVTAADLLPGETLVPGMHWLVARGGDERGLPGAMFFQIPMKLPLEMRANTGPNVRAALEALREHAEFRSLMDRYYWYGPKAGEPGYTDEHALSG